MVGGWGCECRETPRAPRWRAVFAGACHKHAKSCVRCTRVVHDNFSRLAHQDARQQGQRAPERFMYLLLVLQDADPAAHGCASASLCSRLGADTSPRLSAASSTASPSSGPEPRPSSVLPAALTAALVIAARLPCPSASPYTWLSLSSSSGTIAPCLTGEETGTLHPTPAALASEAREASWLSHGGCPQPFECAKTNQANWAHRLRVWSFL